MQIDHRLVMELLRSGGETVGHVGLTPDWDPALECLRLTGLRTHGVWAPEPSAERTLEPLWHAKLGEPYTSGFRVHLASPEGDTEVRWYEDFSITYFAELASAASTSLVEQGVLAEGEHFLYQVLAYATPDTGPASGVAAFTTIDQRPPLPVRTVSVGALVAVSAQDGDTQTGDVEVFVPSAVLDEAAALTRQAGDVETGGILIGHLDREPGARDIAVEITALIPARHTLSHSKKLTFTTDTWTDVRGAVALRGLDELVLGWFHSHPQLAWCREKGCPLEQQQRCSAADGFFSADDASLHRTMFPRAFTVALVMTHSVKGVLPRLFGWRGGRLEPRGFRVLANPARTGDRIHATPTLA